MNCQEFHSNIDSLARCALLDARTRDDAAAHEESCSLCAARLADERALTAGLRALAATMREASAPERSESALLSAFRSRAAASNAHAAEASGSTTAAHSNVVSLSEYEGARQWSWVRTVAVAALAAAAVALFMLVPPYLSSPVPTGTRESAANKSQGAPVQTQNSSGTTSDAGQQETERAEVKQSASSSGGAGSQNSKGVDEDLVSHTPAPRRAAVRGMNVGYGLGSTRGAAPDRDTAAESAGAREITTEFIPLVQDGGFTQSEGVHLVRVELPRSALTSFGIPVNAEQAGGRIKADVLLGEDGTARAIRFVR